MLLPITFLACLTSLKLTDSSAYVNILTAPFNFECPPNQHISYIGSVHSNRAEDRLWDLQCRSSGRTVRCATSGFINNFDGVMNFNCSGNQVLTGLASEFDSFYKDRKFKAQCCAIQRKQPKNCTWSGFVNEYDKPIGFTVPSGQVIKGLHSVHDNYYEDRRWKFLTCEL
ncbi:hypothetical protein Btru_042746 [Bulinus truncatus]|nr:hypothetical protein Btru_042746 [Bulinus truncatus]